METCSNNWNYLYANHTTEEDLDYGSVRLDREGAVSSCGRCFYSIFAIIAIIMIKSTSIVFLHQSPFIKLWCLNLLSVLFVLLY